jgi:hypothetical protein
MGSRTAVPMGVNLGEEAGVSAEIGWRYQTLGAPPREWALPPQAERWMRWWDACRSRRTVAQQASLFSDAAKQLDLFEGYLSTRMGRPLSADLVQDVHAAATHGQREVVLRDTAGRRLEVAHRPGQYKTQPNNPTRPDGKIHEWCPVDLVDSEVAAWAAGAEQLSSAPVLVRMVWAIHGAIRVHAFADGNGRVGRTLASFQALRAGLPPLTVPDRRRQAYTDAANALHQGDFAPMMAFISERMEEGLLSWLHDWPSPWDAAEGKTLAEHLSWNEAQRARDPALDLGQRRALLGAVAPALHQGLQEALGGWAQVSGADGQGHLDPPLAERLRLAARTEGAGRPMSPKGTMTSLVVTVPGPANLVAEVVFGQPGTGFGGAMSGWVGLRLAEDPEGRWAQPDEPGPGLLLLPEEPEAERQARARLWVRRALSHAVGPWKRRL